MSALSGGCALMLVVEAGNDTRKTQAIGLTLGVI
jgi:hypothetical protein